MEYNNANELNYLLEKIHHLFSDEDMEISDETIITVIQVYDRLYTFLRERNLVPKNTYKERYNFVYNKEYITNEEDNYDLFKSLIELADKKGFYLLNYSMILAKLHENYFFTHGGNNIERLDLLLTLYLTFFDEENELEDYYISNHVNCLDEIINEHYHDIIDSNSIDQNEKNVLIKINDIYLKDQLFRNYSSFSSYHDYFIPFINVSWAYFVINNKIIYEYNKVMDYLDTIYNHFDEVIFKMINSDIYEGSELLNFIKTLYDDKNKILNLKQIN